MDAAAIDHSLPGALEFFQSTVSKILFHLLRDSRGSWASCLHSPPGAGCSAAYQARSNFAQLDGLRTKASSMENLQKTSTERNTLDCAGWRVDLQMVAEPCTFQ